MFHKVKFQTSYQVAKTLRVLFICVWHKCSIIKKIHVVFSTTFILQIFPPSFPPPSLSICPCACGLIAPRVTYSVHISLASPSHSSPRRPPTAGYYCLVKGKLGRHWLDKSIKLPLAVPRDGGGRWIEMDSVTSERISQCAPLPNGVGGSMCWGSTQSPTVAELLFSHILKGITLAAEGRSVDHVEHAQHASWAKTTSN